MLLDVTIGAEARADSYREGLKAMVNRLKTVFHSDGSQGLEHTIGSMRFDIANPTAPPTYLMGSADPHAQNVVRPDGTPATEFTFGSMRTSTDKSGFDLLL